MCHRECTRRLSQPYIVCVLEPNSVFRANFVPYSCPTSALGTVIATDLCNSADTGAAPMNIFLNEPREKYLVAGC